MGIFLYEHLLDYQALYQYLKERLCADKITYIFLDEIRRYFASGRYQIICYFLNRKRTADYTCKILRNTFQQYDISNFANAAILFFAARTGY